MNTTAHVRPVKGLTGEIEFFWTVFSNRSLIASGIEATEHDAERAAEAAFGEAVSE